MAKYTVTYKCEHTDEVTLFGPEKERTSKRAWLATQDCPACKKEREQQQAQADAQTQDLPALTGSEKQVAWAERIRHKELVAADDWYQNLKAKISDPTELQQSEAAYVVARQRMADQSTAKWWIDEANGSGAMVLRKWMQEAWRA